MSIAEVWRDIGGWEGLYQVSNLGRVRSLDGVQYHEEGGLMQKKGQILKCEKNKKTGYVNCVLNRFGRKKTYLVHRLVAKAFQDICGKWFDNCVVDHIDTERGNNVAYNLRVCTHHENNMNPITRKRYSEMQKGKKKNYSVWNKGKKFPNLSGTSSPRSRAILQLGLDGSVIREWVNTAVAGDTLGISKTSITNCLSGRTKTANKSKWKYKE